MTTDSCIFLVFRNAISKVLRFFLRVLCKPEVESIVIPAEWAATPMEVLNIMADSGGG